MKVTVTLEYRFTRTPDGAVWTQTTYSNSFWERYLEVFDSVRVVARARNVEYVPDNWKRVNGERVSFLAVPYYVGPWQYLRRAIEIASVLRNAVTPKDAVIMRVPSPFVRLVTPLLKRRGQPYCLEVVGDPYDVFAPGAVNHLLRPFFRWWFTHQLQQQCMEASAIAYVTQITLQLRYPTQASNNSFFNPSLDLRRLSSESNPYHNSWNTYYSDVELPPKAFMPRHYQQSGQKMYGFTLVTVASLEQMYKAMDVLIDALAICLQEGLNLNLVIVGDGKHRRQLEVRAAKRGVEGRVKFLGQLPAGDVVRAQLDQADLFILPSRTEGMPRAMVEAMARGLPCIGSRVGGIPELLPPEDLVKPGDSLALARKIGEVLMDPGRLMRMSERNFEKSREYLEEALHERRINFYRAVKENTETWLRGKKSN